MNRAIRFAIFSVTATLVVLFVLWQMYVKAPPPEIVCEHKVQTTIAEVQARGMSKNNQATVVEQMQDRCVRRLYDKIQFRGRIDYASYAKCVLASTTLEAIERC